MDWKIERRPLIAVLAALGATGIGATAQAGIGTTSVERLLPGSNGAARDEFGTSVALDGNYAIVGAYKGDGTIGNSGTAHAFRFDGNRWVPNGVLMASDGGSGEAFGQSVAIDGSWAVVGAFLHNGTGANAGAVYAYLRNSEGWLERAKLVSADIEPVDNFGLSVALSGDTAVIGAWGDDDNGANAGAVYVFTRIGTNWSEQAKLLPDDGDTWDRFGVSVAVDGDTAIIGAAADDPLGSSSGSVYVFTRSGSVWTQQDKIVPADGTAFDEFGWSVDIDGNTALIGARWDDSGAADAGSAYVFLRSGTSWSQQAKLLPGDPVSGAQFGYVVSLDADTAVVGRPYDPYLGANTGSAYVFVRSGTSWSQQERLVAGDAAAGDEFGYAAAVAGDRVLCGARVGGTPFVADAGTAHAFERQGTSWSETEEVRARDDGERHGQSVALAGDRAVVGTPEADTPGPPATQSTGALVVYQRTVSGWVEEQHLFAADAQADDGLGWSVAIDGSTVVAGAPWEDHAGSRSGAAYVFVHSGTMWSQEAKLVAADAEPSDDFGAWVDLEGDTIVIGSMRDDDDGSGSGSAYVFVRSGTTWSQEAKLVASDASAGDWFGASVALSGDTLLVGAREDDATGEGSGSAYVFVRSGTAWSEQTKIVPLPGTTNAAFGWSVALQGDTALVGEPFGDGATTDSGLVHVFARNGTTWSRETTLVASNGATNDALGYSVAFDGAYAAVGQPWIGSVGFAYVYTRLGPVWRERLILTTPDPGKANLFGHSVAIEWSFSEQAVQLLVGSPGDPIEGGDSRGAAWMHRLEGDPNSFCDGSDGALALCPCANAGSPDSGCDNAQGTGGVRLAIQNFVPNGSGGGSVELVGSGYPPASQPGVTVIRAPAPEDPPVVFGDGLRCIGVSGLVRVGSTLASGGVSLNALSHGAGAGSYYYQTWYRNNPSTFCDGLAAFNLSSAVEINWP